MIKADMRQAFEQVMSSLHVRSMQKIREINIVDMFKQVTLL